MPLAAPLQPAAAEARVEVEEKKFCCTRKSSRVSTADRMTTGELRCCSDGTAVADEDPMQATLTALDVIFSRRSIRAYKPDALDDGTVRSLLDAAVQAPTAVHEEPWTFLIVQDRDALKRISERAKSLLLASADEHRDVQARGEAADAFLKRLADPAFSVFYDAGTLIVVCARMRGPFVTADCWLAAENLMLAATALGLGCCVIGSAVPALNDPEIKRALGVPHDVDAVVPIIAGVPAAPESAPALRADPRIVNWLRPRDGRHKP